MSVDERWDDDRLLEALDAAIEAAQPMPPSVLSLGRAAWDARALDAEFAQLVGDSLLDEELAQDGRFAVRGATGPRLLSFAAGDLAIELEVDVESGGSQSLVGQLLPPGSATVSFERGAAVEDVQADDGGRFELRDVAPGPARLIVRRASDVPLASAWFRL